MTTYTRVFDPAYIEGLRDACAALREERAALLQALREAYEIVGIRALQNRKDAEIIRAAQILGNAIAKHTI